MKEEILKTDSPLRQHGEVSFVEAKAIGITELPTEGSAS